MQTTRIGAEHLPDILAYIRALRIIVTSGWHMTPEGNMKLMTLVISVGRYSLYQFLEDVTWAWRQEERISCHGNRKSCINVTM